MSHSFEKIINITSGGYLEGNPDFAEFKHIAASVVPGSWGTLNTFRFWYRSSDYNNGTELPIHWTTDDVKADTGNDFQLYWRSSNATHCSSSFGCWPFFFIFPPQR